MRKLNIEELFANYNNQMDEFYKKADILRENGSAKVIVLNSQIKTIKKSKVLSEEEKESKINLINSQIEDAKKIEVANKQSIKDIVKNAKDYSNNSFAPLYMEVKEYTKTEIASIKLAAKNELLTEKQSYVSKVAKINSDFDLKSCDEHQKIIHKNELDSCKNNYKNIVKEIKSKKQSDIQKFKDIRHSAYLNQMDRLFDLRDGKNTVTEKVSICVEDYLDKFKLNDFLLKNGLYIIIISFMILCVCINPKLISANTIALILKNFSTKVFFALGVASLILFGGTDLSVGRMVTLSSLITCMLLNPTTDTTFLGVSFNSVYLTIGFFPTFILALLLSIISCVLFSLIAGYFTAKFKIHPFITTLGTSLIIWGILGFGTSYIKTGTITQEARSFVKMVFVNPDTGFVGLPLALIYAIIAIFITWFVWNKTTFGKNMYAVGGNSEAAAVSGINVFKVTMGIFGFSAILYGVGGFLQGLTTGSSYASFGQGWELEAIAACIVGGISFSGGIGKISGAVIGCLLFEILKYYLRDVTGGSTDITNIFIGSIIIIAVTFDSMKYLKKK